ncbi:dTDP-glucose 4,6-dehydratase [Sporosarcina sp. E16_8]|uniref:dTDP-glucose 4,6-dehydratase n=1 Tax=Sporosarcina sp. E16_8 TaxID=2789295 RepID=UPI001A92212A|nr:dTDP-glucose 4,6-dehydratase [Sporosarcina sp. E16_8]MBO0588608.1 dTDP-glucose 4,6-dehydratase [Sporosarcina sp. E16_8]
MNILVTGGAGFIGSNFIKHMLSTYDYKIINLDLLTYAGNLSNLEDSAGSENYHFVKGDICDAQLLKEIFERYDIQVVINFAAESHVDRSIADPALFLKTNVLGTQTLLEVARKHWEINPDDKACRKFSDHVKYIQISTDEVYGTLGNSGYFTEQTNLAPNSPYSASKASADLIVRAYYETYALPIMITRCSNNYGPYQFPEKLIPLMISKALKEEPLPVYGDGRQVRDWLYVEDHCIAIDTVLHKGEIGEVYNIGGNNERPNIEVVKFLISQLGKDEKLIESVEDRLGHDKRYAIDNSKITKKLGWSPAITFERGLKMTIEWYLNNTDRLEPANIREIVS